MSDLRTPSANRVAHRYVEAGLADWLRGFKTFRNVKELARVIEKTLASQYAADVRVEPSQKGPELASFNFRMVPEDPKRLRNIGQEVAGVLGKAGVNIMNKFTQRPMFFITGTGGFGPYSVQGFLEVHSDYLKQ